MKIRPFASLILVLSIVSSLLLPSCAGKEAEFYDVNFTSMDTLVTVRLARDSMDQSKKRSERYFDSSYLDTVGAECERIAVDIEGKLSRTIEGGFVSEINGECDYVLSVDSDIYGLFEDSYAICENTNGTFDITLGTIVELWNVTGDESKVPTEDEIADALSHTGRDKILLENGNIKKADRMAKFDLGAVGKGFALGKIVEYLESTDVVYGLVSFGGNVAVFGDRSGGKKDDPVPFKVGITDPADTSEVVGYLYMTDGYLSVSGDYERFFIGDDGTKYHHIFDPATGYPADSDISSVAVISEDGALADALSTALFVMGSETAIEFYESGIYDFEAVICTHFGELIVTDGIADDTFEKYVPETEAET